MPLFRKKPVVISAEQFTVNHTPRGVVLDSDSETGYSVDTLEGRALNVSFGDWIITGVKGERYPCKPDVFASTYEPAN